MQNRNRKKPMIWSILILILVLGALQTGNKVYAAITTYTVSYNANQGTGAPATQVKQKDKVMLLSKNIPKRTGYIFKGWSASSTAKTASYKPGSAYTSNKSIRLYAVWEAETYEISYNMNGGTGVIPNQTKTYKKNLTLTEKEPKRTGYTFRGWSESRSATIETYKPKSTFNKNCDTVLYAVWKINQYRVTYHALGAKGVPAGQTKTYGKKLILSSQEPILAAAEFRGWATTSGGLTVAYLPGQAYMSNKSIDLYAVWKWRTYKVTYHANGGSGGPASQLKSHEKDMKITKSVPHRSGYTFLGWGLSSNSTTVKYYPGDNYKTNVKEELYAMWGKTKSKSWNISDILYQLGSGVGLFKANFTYAEDYLKKGTQTHFYKHAIYLEIDYSMTMDEENIVVYPPASVMHENSKGKEINSFLLNKKEDTLAHKDYVFSYSNRKKVTYTNNQKVVGSSGFFLRYDSDNWYPKKKMGMDLTGDILKTVSRNEKSSEDSNKDYYYSLGEIEKEYMNHEQKGGVLTRTIAPQIAIVSGNYTIYDSDIKCYIKEKQLQKEILREDIIEIIEKIVINRALEEEAIYADCEKNIEDAKDYIQELREEIKKADNYEEYLMMIAGTKMDEEEYWKKKEEEYRLQLTKKAYINKLYHEYKQKQSLSISEKYQEIQKLIDEKIEDKEEFTKQEFIIALKSSIVEKNNIAINEKEIEKYL